MSWDEAKLHASGLCLYQLETAMNELVNNFVFQVVFLWLLYSQLGLLLLSTHILSPLTVPLSVSSHKTLTHHLKSYTSATLFYYFFRESAYRGESSSYVEISGQWTTTVLIVAWKVDGVVRQWCNNGVVSSWKPFGLLGRIHHRNLLGEKDSRFLALAMMLTMRRLRRDSMDDVVGEYG